MFLKSSICFKMTHFIFQALVFLYFSNSVVFLNVLSLLQSFSLVFPGVVHYFIVLKSERRAGFA